MEQPIFKFADLEIYHRGESYFVRYDAGSHQVVMREDVISEADALLIQSGKEGMESVMFGLQKKLIAQGIDPYVSNYAHA